MKKTLLIGLALGVVAISATSSFAADLRPATSKGSAAITPQGCVGGGWDCNDQKNFGGNGIIGSSHDMTNVGTLVGAARNTGADATEIATGTNLDAQNRICVYCHHPHNAVSINDDLNTGTDVENASYSPLWNRRANAARNYTGYNNGSMMANSGTDATDKRHVLNAAEEGGGVGIKGVSLLCMSCHDGVTAMSAYSQSNNSGKTGSTLNGQDATNPTNALSTSLASSFEGDMNNHHPMGFKYNAVQAVDEEIADSGTIMVKTTQVDIQGLLYGTGQDGTMECVTCHDVHNTANEPGAERFLWRSDNNSNFCLTCHLK